MKSFVYRKLITIMRILIIIALLFQQNAAVAEAQNNILTYDRGLVASASMGNEREFNFDVLSTAVPSNTILYRFPITKGHISIRGANSAASHEGGAIDLVATDWNVLAVADGEVFDIHYDSNVNCVSYDNYKTWYYRNGHPKAGQRCPFGEANYIRILHGNGEISNYFHLAQNSIPEKFRHVNGGVSMPVAEGEFIGKMGNTGWSDGAHLHFFVQKKQHNKYFKETTYQATLYSGNIAYPISKLKGTGTNNSYFPVCPRFNDEVIFYKEKNFGCGNLGSGKGYVGMYEREIPQDLVIGTDIEFTPKSVSFPEPNLSSQGIDPTKIYLIRTLMSSNFVLDANSDTTTQIQKPVIQWWWHGINNQRWQFEVIDSTYYHIKSLYNDKCLAVIPYLAGYKVTLMSCSGENTKWKLNPDLLENGDYRIISAMKTLAGVEMALTSPGNSTGDSLIVSPINASSLLGNQKWHLCEVNRIKVELKKDGSVFERKFTSGDIENWQNITSMYVAGTGCSTSVNGLSAQAACVSNQSPNPPLLVSPTQSHGNIHEPPTLSWKSGGDPDNVQLDFQIEVSNSAQTIYSGWIQNTSWKPVELSKAYGTYQWRVRARDPELAVSTWSATRSFTILSPNGLPTINFQTANGNTSEKIFTRDTTWSFTGTASDPESQLNRVEFLCKGDNCGSQNAHTGLTSWSHTQTNLSGQNDIYFVAYDNYLANNPSGQATISRHLDLRIDLAAPTTTPNLNGQSNAAQWPLWFTMPVNVKLHGADNGTGRATVGMGKIHYRLDNGTWQVVNGSDSAFTISSDGSHIVEYYSEDALGNTEASRSFSFQIDKTPPSLPANLQESHGTTNDQWQKNQNIPNFIWNAATDATSGLRGYQLYFGDDPNGIGYKNILASEPRQWTPFPAGLPTGISYLRARTQDNASNWSAWATLFTFRYDGTPPENPSDVTHAAGITTAWQKTSSSADFSWISAHDEGSGIKGYHVYWGNEPDATAATFVKANVFKDLTSLCATNASCTGYLRLRSEDNVGNLAEDWNTVFILRYDNAPPVVDFSFNGGATSTAQSQVTLNVTASDEGSGIYAVRFSDDGQNWKEWEQPANERLWNIYAISRQSWPVYAQVKDHVGLLSDVVQHDVYFDVNPAQPKSLNYRLFDHGFSGGSGSYGSTSYSGRGTLSQVTSSPASSSVHYTLLNGYEAGSQAIPLIVPGHEEYTFMDGIFASGVITDSLQSASYKMILTVGGIGLSSTTTIDSVNYQHQPGFLANVQWRQPAGPSVIEQPEVPAPDPEPLLACDAPLVSINNGEVYTDTPNVTLSLCAPYAVEMMVSAQMDFAGAVWEPFVFSKSWVISTAGSTVEPRFVYVQFRDVNGKLHAGYFDDILYDPNQPNGSLLLSDDINAQPPLANAQFNSMSASQSRVAATGSEPTALQAAPDGSVTLYVDGFDDNSGLVEMQISATPAFIDAVWQQFSPAVSYVPGGDDGPKTVYARFQDGAGNLSGTAAIDFLYDTQPPDGYIYADPAVLPGDAITTTLYLGGYNSWDAYYDETTPAPTYDGGAVEMRLGSDPNLVNAYWQPLTDTVIAAVDPTLSEGAYYVQYRDAAGNVSEIYSTAYYIDTIAPNLSAVADPGDGDTRNISFYAEDDLSGVANLYLSNDPLMQLEVVTLEYTETLSWIFDSKKVVWIVAEDSVGNRSQPYPVYATELGDTANPMVTSITRASVSSTSATSVNFTVTFSKSVIGVDETDFSLTTGGITNATVGGVSGMDSIYIVTVNTGSGNGTIRLDLIDNNSIVDAASNPLGGATMGDGNFTTGEVYNITKSAGGDTTGVFRPSNGLLYLKNTNTTGFADVAINYGTAGDYPIAGDWDGNGTATIGIYRNGLFYLRNSNTLGFADIVFAFGTPGDQPVAGDWNGDGVDTIGVYSNGQFLLRNSNSAGTADMSFFLGNPGDVGIAGDWNGDGMDTTGVFRPSNGIIFLKNANTTGFADVALNYGLSGDMPVTGDWNNDGIDTIGVYRNAQFLLRNSNTIGFAEIVFGLGNPGDMPISGNWDGIP